MPQLNIDKQSITKAALFPMQNTVSIPHKNNITR
jgi:hypothetical protein